MFYNPDMKTISYIVPVYNEEEGIADFLEGKLIPVVKRVKKYSYEILLVDDGSSDGSLKILQRLADENPKIKVIAFSRNFGKEMALTAGLRNCTGDAALMIDADGQQPPELIPDFIEKWEAGADIVAGVRSEYTKHGFIAKTGSKLFYKIMKWLGGKDQAMSADSTDFRLLDRVVIDEFNSLSEHNRITRGLLDWVGFDQAEVKYIYGERMAGKPSYDFKKLFALAINSFVSLSTTPLVIFGYIGIVITVLSFLLGIFVIIQQYILGDPLGLYWNGAVQMAIFITFLVGLVLISQAVTALYVSHIHAETQGRPLYIINQKKSRNLTILKENKKNR